MRPPVRSRRRIVGDHRPDVSSIWPASAGRSPASRPRAQSGRGPPPSSHPPGAAAASSAARRAPPIDRSVTCHRSRPSGMRAHAKPGRGPGAAAAGFADEQCGPRPLSAMAAVAHGADDAADDRAGKRLVGDDLAGDRAAGGAGDDARVERVSPQAASRRTRRRRRGAMSLCIGCLLSPGAGAPPAHPQAGRAAAATPHRAPTARPRPLTSSSKTSGKLCRARVDVDPQQRLVARRDRRAPPPAPPRGRAASPAARRRGCRARTAPRRNAPRAPRGTPRPPPGRAAAGRHSARAP